MKFLSILALAGLSLIGAEAMRDITSKELIKEMKVGWSLGNTLDSDCTSWLDYSEDEIASETCWGNVKTTENIFKKLISTNFNVFRIPTTWSGHFDAEYNIKSAWMQRVHEIVDYGYKNGGYVILNIHHETWNHAFAENLTKAKGILKKVWTQISEEFKDYDEKLIFEGLNEPRKVGDPVEWTGGDSDGWNFVNEMNKVFIDTVRSTGGNNKLRHLMIPTYAASVTDGSLNNFIYPSGDDKLIVSLHAYTPYNFALNNGDGAVSVFNAPNEIDWLMSMIQTRFRSKDIPVIIGEYGAMNRDNEDERAKWVDYYIKKATAMGIPCVWWDNGLFEGKGERFGLLDRTTYKITYPKLVKSLLNAKGLEYVEEFDPTIPVEPEVPEACWAKSLGYECCSDANTSSVYTDNDGEWGIENGNWCGIVGGPTTPATCWSKSLGYDCCTGCDVVYTDSDGKWGVENDAWCGVSC